mgnify:FL=1
MKLHRLRLENFRQFKGVQEIEFSCDREKNVTLIWGANGAGKTTLLNAFTWVLYGSFTKDFEKPEALVNRDTWMELNAGDQIRVSIELEFENDDQIFTARRSVTYRKGEDGSQTIVEEVKPYLAFIDQTGRSQLSGDPDDHIRQILPERLHSFFFFNGERIEHLVHASAYKEIEDAIKTILGLKVVERAIKHLPEAAKRFEQELKQYGTAEQKDITRGLEQVDEDIEKAKLEYAESQQLVAECEEEIRVLDEKLRGSDEARSKQRRREELERQERSGVEAIGRLSARVGSLINEQGFLAFGGQLFDQVRTQFEVKRQKKELPAPVKREFIDDLLSDGQCICGASLREGTEGYHNIMAWKSRAGLVDVEQRWHMLCAWAEKYRSQRSEFSRELDRLLDERTEKKVELNQIRQQLSGLSASLQNITKDNIDVLESRRAAAQKQKDEEIRRQGRLDLSITQLNEKKAALERDLKRVASVEAKAELASRRVTVTRDALNTLEQVYRIRTEQTRTDLDAKIKEVYRSISYKPYVPVLDENFQLNLMYAGEPVAKSTGENQILSLSFVGALASIARSRWEETKGSAVGSADVRGGVYPIVMDAAFGSLDLNYRKEVALGLPQLAEQVVVIVSKSGGEGTYEHLRDRVGKSYVIEYHTPKDGMVPELIEIDGKQFSYIDRTNDGAEFAAIVEAK